MKIQPIDNNITMKALYFPKKPSNLYVSNEEYINAIKNNPFISKLSEQADIFVRYWNAKDVYYSMNIDIVDLQKLKTLASLSYISKTSGTKPNVSEQEFISQIKEPHADKKGNLLKKIMRCSRMHTENADCYHMGFTGPHLVKRKFGKMPYCNEKFLKFTIKIQKEYMDMNKEVMTEINKTNIK